MRADFSVQVHIVFKSSEALSKRMQDKDALSADPAFLESRLGRPRPLANLQRAICFDPDGQDEMGENDQKDPFAA